MDDVILMMLKEDLGINTSKRDRYLLNLMQAAKAYIKHEGIDLTLDYGDCVLVEMYAAALYRSRKKDNFTMPRMLRFALNNRALFGGEKC